MSSISSAAGSANYDHTKGPSPQLYCCGVPVPEFDSESGYLPAGEHVAAWSEVVDRFGWNSVRRAQLEGLCEALNLLGTAGVDVFGLTAVS
jgi:hypothetical protein